MSSEPVRIPEPVKFGEDYELDVPAYELRRSGKPLKLERIPMELLVLLVEMRGQLVTRDQIIERIWGKGVFLDTDNSINSAIRKLRQVLKDDPDRPRFVVTVTGKGYRFVAPVEEPGPRGTQPTPAPEETTAAGDNLLGKKISHYRVIQMLGGGGMGVVYKAEDLKLGRQVALKFLPGELAKDPVAFDRLQREARAASALDHANICSIYQLGEHEGQPFIVMQLLEGETLREWIDNATRLAATTRVRELLDLARQVTDGLEAAHQKGIVHRDIKPANIFVTSRGQAKILDFGVAKFVDDVPEPKSESVAGDDAARSASVDPHLTRTGASVGTPSYLSPEQIRREKLDARTDLFSFGLVLYEMATGQRAFSGKTVTAIRDAVLQLPPESVRHLNPEIPEELCAVISKALEKDRRLRYQTAGELRSDLERLSSVWASLPATPVRAEASSNPVARPKMHWKILVPVVAGLAVAIGSYWALGKRGTSASAGSTMHARRSVAVLGFDNLGGQRDADWLSTGLSQMLSTELAAGGKLRLIPGEDVARAKTDLHITDTGALSKYNLSRLHKNLGVDLVVFGAYTVLPDRATRLDLRLEDTSNGETVAALAETGNEDKLFELISAAGSDMRQRLGVGQVPNTSEATVRASLPSNPEAARLFSEGLDKLRILDALEARDLLLKAAELDPNHAATHSALADAWRNLGYDAKAQEEAQKAVDLSASLGAEDRLRFQAQLHQVRHEWDKAETAYRTLFKDSPDSLEYGMQLASVQMSAAKSRDALATVGLLRKLPVPARDDPRIDVMEANANAQLGDYNQELALATRATQVARAQESVLVAARGLSSQCEALRNLARFQQAVAAGEEAQRLFSAGGDRSHAAAQVSAIALTLQDQGDLAGARARYQEALIIAQKIGDKRGEARYSNNLANDLSAQSDFNGALRMFKQSLKIAQEIGDKRGATNTLGNIGLNLELVGNLAGARSKFEEALALARETGNKQGEASNEIHLAELLFIQGDLAGTSHALESADALLQGTGDKRHHLYALYSWSDLLCARNDLPGARRKIEEALETSKQISARDLIAFSQMSLANLTVEEGHPSEAIPLAQAAVNEFQAEKAPDFEVQALESLASALLKTGKATEANDAMQRAKTLLAQLKDPMMEIDLTTSSAQAAAAIGNPERTIVPLRSAITNAHRMGIVGHEFEARLVLGEIELRHGSEKSGRLRLQQLQRDAQAKGFLLMAQKASAALNQESRHL